MEIIPVIDLLGGQVVRAMGAAGREAYRPLVTSLADPADPAALARAMLRVAGARRIYFADLDAIAGRESNALPQGLEADEAWLDAGGRAVAGYVTVFGTESLEHLPETPVDGILSLDFRSHFIGPPRLDAKVELWPQRLIVLTFARIGGESGPDWQRIETVVKRAEGRQVYAAGGVRGRADLARLGEMGCTGALVSSALHAGLLP